MKIKPLQFITQETPESRFVRRKLTASTPWGWEYIIKERSRDGVWVVEWQIDRGISELIMWRSAASVGNAVDKCMFDYASIIQECLEDIANG